MAEMVYSENGITLFQGDARDIVALGGTEKVDLVLTDPPYGIKLKTDYKDRKRGPLAGANNYAPIIGDDEPFDPRFLLVFKRLILFGANYYAEKLPPSPSWIVWDKLNGLETEKREIGFCDQADLELAWTNLGGQARIIPHRWMGMLKDSERRERRVHPTQKPIALMEKLIEWYSEPGDLIFDPYAGSGSTLIAALRQGRKAVGVELAPEYCQTIINRLESEKASAA